MNIRLSDIAKILDTYFIGEDIEICELNLCNRIIETDNILSYCSDTKYLKMALTNSKVKALILSEAMKREYETFHNRDISLIINDKPEATFYNLYIYFYKNGYYPCYNWITDISSCSIESGAIIERGVKIGNNVRIGHNSVIKSGTIIGDNVTIGCCSVIGNDGFQLIKDREGKNMSIPHIGRVLISDNVTIGDNVTIAKSLFGGYTKILSYTKIDNHVHIAHNCIIGKNCAITAGCILFGSCEVKDDVWIGPNSSIMNKVIISEKSYICASSFVIRNVESGSKMFGCPAQKINF